MQTFKHGHPVNRSVGQPSKGRIIGYDFYVAHVIIGMGVLEALGLLENQPLSFAVGSAIIFCVVAVLFSVLWMKRFNRGPLEWVMRQVTR
jgi:uncharacterized membrane protein YeiB